MKSWKRYLSRFTKLLLKKNRSSNGRNGNFIANLTRSLLGSSKRSSQKGFVLPTSILLIVLTGLILTSLLTRSSNRATQVIGDKKGSIVSNAATPALERAQAKLNYLLTQDGSISSGLPNDQQIVGVLSSTAKTSPYLFPDEVQLDINGGGPDAAWSFSSDTDGDGKPETIAYSIISNVSSGSYNRTSPDTDKASSLIVRGAPPTITAQGSAICSSFSASTVSPNGWDPISTSSFGRTFQVNALAVGNSNAINKGAIATAELQQYRTADVGTKWGAFFKYDIETNTGKPFIFNGAMHTEGNLIVTGNGGDGSQDPVNNLGVHFFLVSSPASCLYTRSNSEITLAGNNDGTVNTANGINFLGNLSSGSIDNAITKGNNVVFDLFSKVTPQKFTSGTYPVPTAYTMSGDPSKATLKPFTYSSVDSSKVTDPSTLSVDPIALVTTGKNQLRDSIGGSTDGTTVQNNTVWNSPQSTPVTYGRIYNSSATTPLVDDTYRADNRYGPKVDYGPTIPIPSGSKVGDLITSADSNYSKLTDLSTGNAIAQGLDGYWERRAWASGLRMVVGQRLELGNAYGWGGPLSSTGTPLLPSITTSPYSTDPLYPTSSFSSTRAHELKQFKALRDNLSAVQSTAVYHVNGSQSGNFPQACLSTVAHPGTLTTLANSTAFADFPGGTGLTQTDFFHGQGTNGWEFDAPAGNSQTQFATNIAASNPLGKALRNLAHFAGDPKGFYPPVQEASGSTIHPYPNLAMWGDFSNLRYVLSLLDSGTSYSDLSLADRTTIETASCTLGMLTYNINGLQSSYNKALAGAIDTGVNEGYNFNLFGPANPQTTTKTAYPSSSSSAAVNLDNLGKLLFRQFFYSSSNPTQVIGTDSNNNGAVCTYASSKWTVNFSAATSAGCPPNSTSPSSIASSWYGTFTARQWLDALNILPTANGGGGGTAATTLTSTNPTMIYARQLLSQIQPYQQVTRDRAYGFAISNDNSTGGKYLSPTSSTSANYIASTATYTVPNAVAGSNITASSTLTLFCDPGTFSTTTPGANIALAEAFCSPGEKPVINASITSPSPSFSPKYPSLYHLFPIVDHYQDGGKGPNVSATAVTTFQLATSQPSGESYVGDSYITSSAVNGKSTTSGYVYSSVQGGNVNTAIDGSAGSYSQVSISPRAVDSWQLPYSNSANYSTLSGLVVTRTNTITSGSKSYAVSFLDKGTFDARELLSLRVLDVDLDLLRSTASNLSGDYWLPISGIVYAFREDALREDGIARPAASGYSNCNTVTLLITNNCYMRATSTSAPKDPPNSSTNNISIKPVDFFPDPDRRIHGFRLSNGLDIRRPPTTIDPNYLNGMTFVTDNPVYIKAQYDYCQIQSPQPCSGSGNGAFNLHTNTSGTLKRIEEFTNLLTDNWSNFYDTITANGRSTPNPDFATIKDAWRPVEIVADSITLLSPSFIDGTVDQGFLANPYQGSFGQMNFPVSSLTGTTLNIPNYWIRENGLVSSTSLSGTTVNNSPILIASNTAPVYCNSSTAVTPCPPANLQQYGRESTPKSFLNILLPQYKAPNAYEPAPPTSSRFNLTAVSGIIPSRKNNSYGGLQNFVRLLEPWCIPAYNSSTGVNSCTSPSTLYVAGAFIQINFSNYSTGLLDHDAWEPGSTPSTNGAVVANLSYYTIPTRAFGYDVGLQFAPAGPLSQRFTSLNNNYSESYRSVNKCDPYISQLASAKLPSGSQIDPSYSSSNCS